MRTGADFIAMAKTALGDPKMSDRELGERLGYKQQTIASAKHGNLSDNLAVKVAHVAGVDPGEVIMSARLEREKDPEIKAVWAAWVGKVSGLLDLERAVLEARVSAGPDTPSLAGLDVAMPKRKSRPHGAASRGGTLAETEGFEPSMRFWRILP